MLVGQNIKYYRGRNHLTINELSRKTGIAASYLTALENEQQTDLSIETLRCIADGLNISAEELLDTKTSRAKEVLSEKEAWGNIVLGIYKTGCSTQELREFIAYHKWKIEKGSSPLQL